MYTFSCLNTPAEDVQNETRMLPAWRKYIVVFIIPACIQKRTGRQDTGRVLGVKQSKTCHKPRSWRKDVKTTMHKRRHIANGGAGTRKSPDKIFISSAELGLS